MSHWWDVPIVVQQPPAGVWPAAVQLCGQQREEQDRHPVDGARGGSQRTTATSPTTGPHYQRVLGQGSGKFIIECGSGSRCKSSSIWIQGVKYEDIFFKTRFEISNSSQIHTCYGKNEFFFFVKSLPFLFQLSVHFRNLLISLFFTYCKQIRIRNTGWFFKFFIFYYRTSI